MYGNLFKKRPRTDSPGSVSPSKRTDDAKTSVTTEVEVITQPPANVLYHYPSTLPFPVLMDATFPAEAYRSRNSEVKSSIHWGQRKLLLSEMQLLCMYCKPGVPYHIVYAGSAPGSHLGFLDEIFASRHTWELVDPGQFDRKVLDPRPNFTLRNEFFTNATAYGINARRLTEVLPALGAVFTWVAVDNVHAERLEVQARLQDIVGTLDVARGTEDIPSMYEEPLRLPRGLDLLAQVALERAKPLLFISDIRSGSVALPNFEEHVAENMRAQECWAIILQAAYSMLKFRLPYTKRAAGFGGQQAVEQTRLIRPDGTVPYLRGDVLLPIWTRPTSTEGRLVVPKGATRMSYNVAEVENKFFFFNTRVREQVHFNHLLNPHKDLDHHFDAAAEVHCLLTYLRFMFPELRNAPQATLQAEVLRVSAAITSHLRISFAAAIRRRDALLLKQATQASTHSAGCADDEEDVHPEQEAAAVHAVVAAREANEVKEHRAPNARHLKKAPEKNGAWIKATKEMIQKAAEARRRAPWRFNIDERAWGTPSGFWVTTKMWQ